MKINPKLKEGDRIILYYMKDEYGSVKPGQKGTVIGLIDDPFEDEKMINVKWDNGSNLNLIPSTDIWKKID